MRPRDVRRPERNAVVYWNWRPAWERSADAWLGFADEVADALERLGDLDCRQLARRGVLELKGPLDLTVDQAGASPLA